MSQLSVRARGVEDPALVKALQDGLRKWVADFRQVAEDDYGAGAADMAWRVSGTLFVEPAEPKDKLL